MIFIKSIIVTTLITACGGTALIRSLTKRNNTLLIGVESMNNVCTHINSTFSCKEVWASGAIGSIVQGKNAEVVLNKLYSSRSNASRWSLDVNTPFDDSLEIRVPYVASQSDISSFAISKKIELFQSEQSCLTPNDVEVTKVQVNSPVHLWRMGDHWADSLASNIVRTTEFREVGTGVIVYVVDGNVANHFEFKSLFNGETRLSKDRYMSEAAKGNKGKSCASSHGTHVASLVAGYTYGLAKDATIIPVSVQPGCGNTGLASDLLQGLAWITQHYLDLPDPRPPGIVTMSLSLSSGTSASISIESTIKGMATIGLVSIVAAGNYDTDACQFSPAQMPEVVTVGALDSFYKKPWEWSNYGSCIDIWSPGKDVLAASSDCEKCSAVYSGTSQATPIVTGLVALYLKNHPDADIYQVKEWLFSYATRMPESPDDSTDLVANYDPRLLDA